MTFSGELILNILQTIISKKIIHTSTKIIEDFITKPITNTIIIIEIICKILVFVNVDILKKFKFDSLLEELDIFGFEILLLV